MDEGRKEVFFSEEKKQKTFIHGVGGQSGVRPGYQKLFGSFLQKRTLILLFFPTLAIAQPAPGIDAPALAALGQYGIGLATLQMAQPGRRLAVDVWYPARPGGKPVTYQTSLAGPDGHPVAFAISGLAVAGADPADGRFPLILLAHGYGNTPEVLAWLGENLASKGYVVAAPAFRDPTTFDLAGVIASVAQRPLDIAFVAAEARRLAQAGTAPFAHADADRMALIGYSMGGYGVVTAAGAALNPPLAAATRGALGHYVAGAAQADRLKVANLKAVVAISPANRIGPMDLWAPGALAAIQVPTFFIAGSQDHVVGYDPGVRTLFENEANAPRYLLTFREAGHNIALTAAPPAMQKRLWDQDWFEDPVWRKSRLTAIVAHFVTAFLDRVVKGDTTKAAYIDGLVANSDDGVWLHPPAASYGAFSPGPPAATLWKGFPAGHAAGMMLEHRPAASH